MCDITLDDVTITLGLGKAKILDGVGFRVRPGRASGS